MWIGVLVFQNLAETPVVAFLQDKVTGAFAHASSSILIMLAGLVLASPQKLWQWRDIAATHGLF
jgi:hypothetical protein